MAYPIVNQSICEVSFEGRLNGQQTISLFHYVVTDSTYITDGQAALEEFIQLLREAGGLFDNYRIPLSTELQGLNIYAQLVYPVRYRYTTDGQPDTTGDAPGGSYPPNVQASITRAAEKSGRKYISHLALPGIPMDAIDNGLIDPLFTASMNGLCDSIVQEHVLAGGATFTPCIWHRTSTPNHDQIVLAFPQPTSRVMRRRTVGLGS